VQFPGRDHRPPGAGMVDFAGLKHIVQPSHMKVLELSPSLSPEEAKMGTTNLQAIWGLE
jgi:hypothetical protein